MRRDKPHSRRKRSLTVADITTTTVLGRRSALAIIGGTVAGTAALLGRTRQTYGADNDATATADPKGQGSDNDTGKRADPIGGRADSDVHVKADPKEGCDADEGDPAGAGSDADTGKGADPEGAGSDDDFGDPCASPDGNVPLSDPIGQGTDNDTGRFADPVGRGTDND